MFNDDDTRRQFFVYVAPVINLAAAVGAQGTVTLSIMADAPFEANYITIQVTQAALIVANWSGTIQIDDSALGRTLFNQAIPVSAISGTGQLPYPLSPPRMFSPNSSIVITANNPVATATVVTVAFHGNKIFSQADLDLGKRS